MAKILILTNVYPIPNINLYGTTSVCHYFAKQWQDNGNEVKVIYNYTIYTPFLHALAQKHAPIICSILPTVINSKRFKNPFEYEHEGIKVLLNPIYKCIPKIPFSNKNISDATHQIVDYLKEEKYEPDIIIGHFLHPNIKILTKLKSILSSPTIIIIHGKYNNRTDRTIVPLLNNIDAIGFRSIPIKNSFSLHISHNHTFLCHSGVPGQYIDDNSWAKHNTQNVSSFLFVGNLINRKNPLAVVKAFSLTSNDDDSKSLTLIGTGVQEHSIKKFIKANHLTNHVHLKGRLKREQVREEMLNNQVFVMISKNETFGLVYLEAMASGCIVVASRNEGMDGIVKDGINGFLCEAGNVSELTKILNKISLLTANERIQISKNAISTANGMTDKLMANQYFLNISKYMNNNN